MTSEDGLRAMRAIDAVEKSRDRALMGHPQAQRAYEWTPSRLASANYQRDHHMVINVSKLTAYMEKNPDCLKRGHKKQIMMDLNMSAHTINKTLKWMQENTNDEAIERAMADAILRDRSWPHVAE